jgi:hypothetical protein
MCPMFAGPSLTLRVLRKGSLGRAEGAPSQPPPNAGNLGEVPTLAPALHTCPAISHRRAGTRGTNGGGRCQGVQVRRRELLSCKGAAPQTHVCGMPSARWPFAIAQGAARPLQGASRRLPSRTHVRDVPNARWKLAWAMGEQLFRRNKEEQ